MNRNTSTKDVSLKNYSTQKVWWKEATVYQIYPRSFQDSNGDGIGDLKGITQRMSYIASLGIDAIWLCPINESPNEDNGYDVSNYKGIMKEMGTMQDFDEMLAAMKKHGIKLIMDLVLNHSSDEHEWFVQAKSSRDNKYRDYYHWWPAEMGKPTHRYSLFDEEADAWRFDSTTNSYYLHYFSRKQPDLNWENPKVRNEMYDIMKFWLDKGVAGFRLDAFPFIAKDTTWPNLQNKNFSYEQWIQYYGAHPKVHDYLQEINEKVLSKYSDVYTIGEGGVIPFSKVIDYISVDKMELNTLYHDELLNIWGRDRFDEGEYKVGKNNLTGLKEIIGKWDAKFENDGWNTVFLTNHDQSRAVSRFGNDAPEFHSASAKMLFTFLLTQRATPYIYNGDEIGMTNIRFKNIEEYNDLQTRNRYYLALKESTAKAAAYLINQQELSRDNSRTPFQWDATTNAGFTAGKPWLPVNENYKNLNAVAQENDPNSILNFVRKLGILRKSKKDILVYGKYKLLDKENINIYAYTREADEKKILILLNFTKEPSSFLLNDIKLGVELINNLSTLNIKNGKVILMPYQACVVELIPFLNFI